MNIGFDIDDTLTNIKQYNKVMAQKYFKETGSSFKVKHSNTGSIKKMYSWSAKEFDKFWAKMKAQFLKNIPVRKDAKTVLKTLKQQGHKIFIITRRFTNNAYERSADWLNNNKIPYDELIVNAGMKVEACKRSKIDLFLDDDILTCDGLNKNNIKAYVLSNEFNHNKKSKSPRVNSLKEFLQIALNYENENIDSLEK